MAHFDHDQDGQLTRADAIVPGSKLLGAARSDHFAFALPFEKTKGSQFGVMIGFSLAMMAGFEVRKRGEGRVHRIFAAVSGLSGSKLRISPGCRGMRWISALVAASIWAARSEVCVAFCPPYISVFWSGKVSLILQKMRLGGGFVQEEIGKWLI